MNRKMTELQELELAIEKAKSSMDLAVRYRVLKELENKKFILENRKI